MNETINKLPVPRKTNKLEQYISFQLTKGIFNIKKFIDYEILSDLVWFV